MTKTRTRDFGATKRLTDFDPLNFMLNGETFNCRPAIQGNTLLDFVAEADSDDGGKAAGALRSFFAKSLTEEDYSKFTLMLDSPDVIVDLSVLGDIAGWLVEEYTSRPTTEPESS